MTRVDFSPDDVAFEAFATAHRFHPLHVEDCRSDEQQAKVESGESYLFIVLKLVHLTHDGELDIADLDLFLGDDYLALVHRTQVPALPNAEANGAEISPARAFYQVLDAVVDSYLPVLDRLEDRVDRLEDLVVRRPDQQILEQIADLLTTSLNLRRVLANTRRVAFALQRISGALIPEDLQPFLRDVHDHLERDLGTAASERERLKGLLDIYHSSVANRNNEATRILTVMGTVSLPAVVIGSFLGMNVKYPGWANWRGSLIVVAALILAVTTGLLLYLKKRNYL